MRIFVAGATGAIGRPLIPLLVSAGHDVTAVARSAERRAFLEQHGARPLSLDLFDPGAVSAALAGHECVINLATHIPPSSRAFLPGAWRENDRVRREVSKHLVSGALAGGASRLIQESFAGMYPDRGDEWIDETVAPEPVPHVRSAMEAERQARQFSEGGGTAVILRFAMFYGAGSSYTADTVSWVCKGIAPTFGRPDGFISSISLDDAAAAVVAALEVPAGDYNICDDEPMRRRAYFDSLAEALGARSPWLPPAWLAGLFGSVARMVARSQRLTNKKFRQASGWSPRYRSVAEGWPTVLAEMGLSSRSSS